MDRFDRHIYAFKMFFLQKYRDKLARYTEMETLSLISILITVKILLSSIPSTFLIYNTQKSKVLQRRLERLMNSRALE